MADRSLPGNIRAGASGDPDRSRMTGAGRHSGHSSRPPSTGRVARAQGRSGRGAGSARRWPMLVLAIMLGITLVVGVGTTATYGYVARTLPSPQALVARHQFQSTKVYDRNG